jgi:predicted Zn-dependent peptidase
MTPSLLHLPNGLRIVALRKDGAPLVTIGVAYHVGSANEEPTKTGYAHLFEHLMFDNFSHPDGKSFDELVTDAGGTSNAYTTFDWTYYHMTLPSTAWQRGIELEATRMREFVITERALDTQRNVVIEEIAENVFNQPYGTVRHLIAHTAFESESCYSWDVYGSVEHLQAMTLEDARQWYERYYRPNNAVLTIVGAIDSTTEVLEYAAECFHSIAPSPQHGERPPYRPARNHHVEHDPSLPADMVVCLYHLPGMHHTHVLITASLLATVLSAGRSSPVARRFVYDQVLAHHALATLDAREQGSLFEFSAIARDKSISAAQLLEHWQTVLAASIELSRQAEHIERARNKIRRRYAQAFQTTEGLADMISTATLLLGDPAYPWHERELVCSLSPDAIAECALELTQQQPAIVEYSTAS